MSSFKKANVVVVLLASIGMYISVTFNACSDVAFDHSSNSDVVKKQVPTIFINNDAQFTNDRQVNLSLWGSFGATEMLISNDANCAEGEWEPFADEKAWELSKENDNVEVFVKYRGDDRVPVGCISDSIVHDNIGPQVIFENPANLVTNNRNVAVKFIVSDSLSGVASTECSEVQEGPYVGCVDRLEYQMLEEGFYNVFVLAKDKAGNESGIQNYSFTIDLTPPVVWISQAPSNPTAAKDSQIAFNGFDKASAVDYFECKLDSVAFWGRCSSPSQTGVLADGLHKFEVRAIDKAGNRSLPAKHDWEIDATAPTVIIISAPPALSNVSIARIEFRELNNDPNMTFECSYDSSAYQACTSPYLASAIADGPHSFSVIGIDLAGNRSAPASVNWRVDTTPPTIKWVLYPDKFASSKDATFTVQVNDANGIKVVECSLDGAAYVSCGKSKTFKGLPEGKHTVSYRATDNAGNPSRVISYSWTVDVTKPVVVITSAPQALEASPDASFAFRAEGEAQTNIAKFECRIDGAAYVDCTSPEAYSSLAQGAHRFYVKATDKAGNVSDPAMHSWKLDTAAPVITYTIEPKDVFVGQTAKLVFAIEDDNSFTYQCTVNGAAYPCKINTEVLITTDAERTYNFRVIAKDELENESRSAKQWAATFRYVEKMTQTKVDEDSPVDILFVIDNSGSMNPERANLAARFDAMISKIEGLDWQIGIISTDYRAIENGDGGFVELRDSSGTLGSHIIKPSNPRAQEIFGHTVQTFPAGHGYEVGIQATYRAIERAMDPAMRVEDKPNRDFFREGAALSVVLLSDEDETYNEVINQPQSLLDLVSATWSGAKNFVFHSIIAKPGDAACLAVQHHRAGQRYFALSQLTGYGAPGGAIVGSVCEGDYTSQLADLGQSVKDMQKSATLQCQPVDADDDGLIDLAVEFKALDAASYVPYTGNPFTSSGVTLAFQDYLEPGDYRFTYKCVE